MSFDTPVTFFVGENGTGKSTLLTGLYRRCAIYHGQSSPILLSCPGAVIYSFGDTQIRRIAYEDTDHYQVYKQFMAPPQFATA